VRALIERKVQGEEITAAPAPAPRAQIIDLMAALKASLAAAPPAAPAPGKPVSLADRKPARPSPRAAASAGSDEPRRGTSKR
jgi:DNA end-binding protein Ku